MLVVVEVVAAVVAAVGAVAAAVSYRHDSLPRQRSVHHSRATTLQ